MTAREVAGIAQAWDEDESEDEREDRDKGGKEAERGDEGKIKEQARAHGASQAPCAQATARRATPAVPSLRVFFHGGWTASRGAPE
jgi:hypothetical protein